MYGGCLLCPLYPLLLLFIWESVWATENCCLYVIRKRVVDIFFWENRSQETEKSKLRYHYTISVVYLFLTLFINQSGIVKFINQRSCWRGKKIGFRQFTSSRKRFSLVLHTSVEGAVGTKCFKIQTVGERPYLSLLVRLSLACCARVIRFRAVYFSYAAASYTRINTMILSLVNL